MKRRLGCWGAAALAVLLLAGQAVAGIEDFKLAKALPADSMVAIYARSHAGQEFLNKQLARVWEAVEKQGFERDVKRLMTALVPQDETDAAAFEAQWQQISDLAAAVEWGQLAEREFAFGMKLGLPVGTDFVVLIMPAEDQVEANFTALTALFKTLGGMLPETQVAFTTDGEGARVVHRLATTQMPPISVTLARQNDVILFGFGVGTGMVEQTLALLGGGGTEGGTALAGTERFQQALKRLPAQAEQVSFVDVARLVAQGREFAKMIAPELAPPTTAPAEGAPAGNTFQWIVSAVNAIDLWDYVAEVQYTDGMQTRGESVVALREEARGKPLREALYGNGPMREPLKYVPVEATTVSVSSGIDFAALYKTVTDFVRKEVPDGELFLTQWEQAQTDMDFNVEAELLSWLGGNFASFTAKRTSAYAPEWVWILDVKDDAKAQAAIEKLSTRLNDVLVAQNGGVEDANLEDAPGFKRVILPAFLAMMPGLGRPVFGVKEGRLFVGNSPDVVKLSLSVAAGQHDNFTKSERYKDACVPLGDQVTGFAYKDLSKLGEELSQMLAMTSMVQMMLPPEATKDPVVTTILSVLNKVGKVTRTLDFYKSSCAVTTFDGKVSTTKTLTTYQEPPKPATQTTTAPAGS